MKTQQFLRFTLLSTVLVAPWLCGIIDFPAFGPLYAAAIVLVFFGVFGCIGIAEKAALSLASAALTVCVIDTGLRYSSLLPVELTHAWPTLPVLTRYLSDIDYHGARFNDLARMAGNSSWREEKLVRIRSDGRGFRNSPNSASSLYDLILLGDSFGTGAVSQEFTWTSFFSTEHRLAAYNLATPASGPWQQYINLGLEIDRLPRKSGATLLWQIFTGNDLDDEYGELDLERLPWADSIHASANAFQSARRRSPIRALLRREKPSADVIDIQFLNGRTLLFYRPYIERSSRSLSDIARHPQFQKLRSTIAKVHQLAQQKQMSLLIVFVPSKEEVYSWVWKKSSSWTADDRTSPFKAALEDLLQERGISSIDLRPHLVQESRRLYENSGQLLYWYDDTHLNVEGNRFITARIADAVSTHPPLH